MECTYDENIVDPDSEEKERDDRAHVVEGQAAVEAEPEGRSWQTEVWL